MVATFFQGVTLGGFIRGIPVVDRVHAGGPLDWLAPFPLFTGLGLMVAYALLGCTWLIMKTGGGLQQRMRRLARPLVLLMLLVIAVISLWTPLVHEGIAQRWFSWPNLLWLSPVPLLVLALSWLLLRRVARGSHGHPFLMALGLVFLGYLGLGISLWPHVIPPSITIWEASGPSQSQLFTLVGTLLTLPLILAYTGWAYHVFRGKVEVDDKYYRGPPGPGVEVGTLGTAPGLAAGAVAAGSGGAGTVGMAVAGSDGGGGWGCWGWWGGEWGDGGWAERGGGWGWAGRDRGGPRAVDAPGTGPGRRGRGRRRGAGGGGGGEGGTAAGGGLQSAHCQP